MSFTALKMLIYRTMGKKMNNKTCGECSWFSEGGNRCKLFINQYIFGDRAACNNFVPKPTNGDVIRQGGNRALAEFKQKLSCGNCVYFDIKMTGQEFCHKPKNKTCTDGIEAWLNAPADAPDTEKGTNDDYDR